MIERYRRWGIHLILFLVTLTTTTFAGTEWQFMRFVGWDAHPITWEWFVKGFAFSLPFLGVLTIHEFGHYFTAKWHKVKVTLPYYIPFWFGFLGWIGLYGLPSIGTMGAVIRIKDHINSRKQFFDIGIAGPLAGFIAALGVLYYGFTHLPPKENIYEIHPEYQYFGDDFEEIVYQQDTFFLTKDYEQQFGPAPTYWPDTMRFGPSDASFALGSNLLMTFFEEYVAPEGDWVPNPYEIIHYPWIFAGYLALFFTALNLIPIGQLDGGHILYGLIGAQWHQKVSATLFILFVFYAGLGTVTMTDMFIESVWGVPLFYISFPFYLMFLYILFSRLTRSPQTNLMVAVAIFTTQFLISSYLNVQGYAGWLVFAFLIGRVLGIYHPVTLINEPLSSGRKVLGWIALLVFVLCFTPNPFGTS
ncbi:MAG: site-2 protease family protein [Bacteroidota bacterium]